MLTRYQAAAPQPPARPPRWDDRAVYDDDFLRLLLSAHRCVADTVLTVGTDWRSDEDRARVAALEAEARKRGIG